MRTTVRIDDELYRRAKARAAQNGQSVGELLEDALREALRPKARSSAVTEPLPTYGQGGVQPGVDLDDSRDLADLLDRDQPLDALR